MAFWQDYLKTLKPLDVEEPIDVWVHRPLAYLLARLAFPTPITPNMITVGSICLGLSSLTCMMLSFRYHLQAAGLLLFSSAVFDCADGQLARMRKTSSALGRMLDGVADLMVSSATVLGSTYLVYRTFQEPAWQGWLAVFMCIVTIVTGSFHTSTYDHYKNVFLRMTHPSYREGEDYESARERYLNTRARSSLVVRFAWPIYLFYVKGQLDYVRGFDPYTAVSLSKLPPYSEQSAAKYRAHMLPLMRLWRTFFGFGSLVFGMSVSVALGILPYYMLFRLFGLNLLFYAYMRPRQRRASQLAFHELSAA